MSESKPATGLFVFFVLGLIFFLYAWRYWMPTLQAVQRIEQKLEQRCKP